MVQFYSSERDVGNAKVHLPDEYSKTWIVGEVGKGEENEILVHVKNQFCIYWTNVWYINTYILSTFIRFCRCIFANCGTLVVYCVTQCWRLIDFIYFWNVLNFSSLRYTVGFIILKFIIGASFAFGVFGSRELAVRCFTPSCSFSLPGYCFRLVLRSMMASRFLSLAQTYFKIARTIWFLMCKKEDATCTELYKFIW